MTDGTYMAPDPDLIEPIVRADEKQPVQRIGSWPEDAVHQLMPHSRRPYDFPVSRDWEDIDCKASGCQYNRNEKCVVPSVCKIGIKGECEGFKPKPMEVRKVDGD